MATVAPAKPKVFRKYPCVRYHKDLAPEGVEILNAAKEAELGDGWVDSPAAFASGYVPLTQDPPEGTVVSQYVKPSKPPIPYPAIRYPRDGGEPVTVGSPEADLALGPGYQDHPWTKAEREAPPSPAAVDTPEGPDGLWGVTVAQAEEVIGEIRDLGELDAIVAREQRNPKGPRKGVLAAVTARMDALTAPAEG